MKLAAVRREARLFPYILAGTVELVLRKQAYPLSGSGKIHRLSRQTLADGGRILGNFNQVNYEPILFATSICDRLGRPKVACTWWN
jgi:hypothetical protein